MTRDLVVKLTAGAEAPERASQALTVAAVGAAAGTRVHLWLTGEASWLATPGRADEVDLPLSPPFSELLSAVLAAGTVTVCSQCAARRGLAEADLLPGVGIAGAAAFVEEILADGVQALVY